MSTTDQLLENNARYAASFNQGGLPMAPGRKVAVLACMDARLVVSKILGLEEGDAHVIRNAGGVATEDAIRSLLISQRLLGTEEIILIHHTDCGMLTFRDDEVKRQIQEESGVRPNFALEAFLTRRRMSASRSTGSRAAPSSRRRATSGASSTTSRPAS